MDTRRNTLKIIGAIGATCAFPFSADELYGQEHAHSHESAGAPVETGPYAPKFFTPAEYATLAVIVDLIIPPTDTPGAVEAGVPQYIDSVVSGNKEHEKNYRDGLVWLNEKSGGAFTARSVDEQVAILTPLSEAVDLRQPSNPGELLFRSVKNMTADGYNTSRIGLVQELGYHGNVALASFPGCTHEH